ncbi:MAG TPA: cyclodeaminase/cyclohydrolase family protein [Firmicutes bacterium]|jgi:formiminotetrahydrofolate cyclodeaminase|nr:cyclodeaminase/cyclohydrolase family protein [Bacillota bacterium]
MSFGEKMCHEFLEELSSKSPVPGGGGAAAMGGAMGMALSNMAGNLTLGKKRYAHVQDEVKELLEKGYKIMEDLKTLVDRDAEIFQPLARAYRLPAGTPEQARYKEETIEACSKEACQAPLEIMRKSFAGIKIIEKMGRMGSTLVISDVGCGAAFLKAALLSASLNIIINTNMIKDQGFVQTITQEMNELRESGCKIADQAWQSVMDKLKKRG